MTSPKPMGPIERELRNFHGSWLRMSNEAFHVCSCASFNLFGDSMCLYWDDLWRDVLSEAIEAASELGL